MDYLNCPFCKRIVEQDYDREGSDEHAVVFEPLETVARGHLLVVARNHVERATESPHITGKVMELAATVALRSNQDCNIITSVGPAAGQTVKHLHVHVVPRTAGGGLALPWDGCGPLA